MHPTGHVAGAAGDQDRLAHFASKMSTAVDYRAMAWLSTLVDLEDT